MYAIEVKNLKKYYQDVKAVDDISFHVEKGELFGFLGVNGAGKSTTIKTLCTLYKPNSGEVFINGIQLGHDNQRIRKQIGVVYQGDCLDDLLSVEDNLLCRGALYEPNKHKLLQQLQHVSEILELKDILKRPFGKLSGGQKRRCEIARALMHAPSILFLDEPTTGLDPSTRKMVWQCIDMLRKMFHMTVFLTTHYMEEAARADHIAVIDKGVIKEFGTPFYLKDTYAKDQCILYPRDELTCVQYIQAQELSYQLVNHVIFITLTSTLDAITIMSFLQPYVHGYEVLQGTMDDVFLNITGSVVKEVA